MPARITADFSEVRALAQRVSRVGPAVERETEQAMRLVVLAGENRVKEKYRVDTGDGRRRVTGRVDRLPGAVGGRVGTTDPKAETLEKGRRPGAAMPPEGSLVGWMRRHGMDPRNEFVLRRAIARRGIKGDHAFRDALAELAPLAAREFAGVADRVRAVVLGAR